MNPEISRAKYEKFVNTQSVKETMKLLTNLLAEMYENDQYHKDAEPLDTLRSKLGMSVPKKSESSEPVDLTTLQNENEDLKHAVNQLRENIRSLES
jgi:hypothetical protein